jgi:hypothetical protein
MRKLRTSEERSTRRACSGCRAEELTVDSRCTRGHCSRRTCSPVNNEWSGETTDHARYADDRNFYKAEKRTKDAAKIERMLYAGDD